MGMERSMLVSMSSFDYGVPIGRLMACARGFPGLIPPNASLVL
jgi:hypothetical protein